jgi:Asp/Glu/hydantoin racemase
MKSNAETIFVINPNSSARVTVGIDRAVDPLRIPGGPRIECLTLKEGPPGIETQRHVDSVVMPLLRLIGELERRADAYVIACFSDPGMHAARETTRKPVFGIMESGILTALTLGQRFGMISILPGSVPRHLRAVGAMGLADRCAGDLSIGLGVAGLSDAKKTLGRMIEVGVTLRDDHGANSLVMGCAGMAQYRDELENAVGIPVVEPTQAATSMAIGRVRLGW